MTKPATAARRRITRFLGVTPVGGIVKDWADAVYEEAPQIVATQTYKNKAQLCL